MLHYQRIAGHQVRPRDAGQLIIGEIPWLDAEDYANGAALHVCLAVGRMELHRSQKALTILRIVGEDVRAERDLAASLIHELAHLKGRVPGEFVDVRTH